MATIHFSLYNETTKNNISGITYLAKPATQKDNDIFNPTPYHIFMGHATGFCKEVYSDMILELRKCGIDSPVTLIDMINHGDSTHDLPSSDWRDCAKDVYTVIEKHIRQKDPNKILIGMGHSMGASVCILVESAHSNTFSCLVLFEPILPEPPYIRPDEVALSAMTLRRRAIFPSMQALYESFSSKPPFSLWTKGSLDSYIKHGFKNSIIDGKEVVELKMAKEQEAEFYRMAATHGGYDLITKLQLPILIVRGTETNFTRDFYESVVKRCRNAEYAEISGTHFFPMEKPAGSAELAVAFIKRHVTNSKL